MQESDKIDIVGLEQWKNVEWARVSEIWEKPGMIMKSTKEGGIDYERMCQGSHRDSNFMTVVFLLTPKSPRI